MLGPDALDRADSVPRTSPWTNTRRGRSLDTFRVLPHLAAHAAAYALAVPIGWNREQAERSAGLRTFPSSPSPGRAGVARPARGAPTGVRRAPKAVLEACGPRLSRGRSCPFWGVPHGRRRPRPSGLIHPPGFIRLRRRGSGHPVHAATAAGPHGGCPLCGAALPGSRPPMPTRAAAKAGPEECAMQAGCIGHLPAAPPRGHRPACRSGEEPRTPTASEAGKRPVTDLQRAHRYRGAHLHGG